jgi:acyl-CoA reductase-like NAD-dependent aldehyde dehydrogenase
MSVPHIPVLRAGKVYESLDKGEIKSVRSGEPVAEISQANAGLIKRDLQRIGSAREILRKIPMAEMLSISEKAGGHFMEATLPVGSAQQSPEDYILALSETSGLPHSLIRRNMGKIHQVFTQMGTILRGLTRGMDPAILDTGYGEQNGVPVSYYPTTHSLGVVLPSNSPGVNSLWMPSVALKIPVVLKPGREEPWTPFRIIQSFIAAGCPPEAFSFYPTDHEGSGTVMASSARAIIFGDVSTVEKYAGNPGVSVHGPGWSKILIGEDMIERWPEFVDLIAQSIVENGGRSCVNASCVVVPKYGDEIAEAVAKKLAEVVPLPATDERATLSGFANPKMAEYIDASINQDLPGAVDVSAKYRQPDRRVTLDGSNYLLPTIVRCKTFDHPLANREFLFPYASIVAAPQDKVLDLIGPSLVVTAITEDPAFIDRVVACPHAERLNLGAIPTTKVSWDQPHEGNLFEFLYRRRAISRV